MTWRRWPDEPSCRGWLHPFNPEARLKEGDIFSYRSCAVHQLISLEYSSTTGQCHIVHTSYHDFRFVSQNLNNFKNTYYDEKDE